MVDAPNEGVLIRTLNPAATPDDPESPFPLAFLLFFCILACDVPTLATLPHPVSKEVRNPVSHSVSLFLFCHAGGQQSSEDAAAVLRALDAEEAARRQLRPAGSGYLGGRGRGRGGDLLGEGSGGCEEILEGPVTC